MDRLTAARVFVEVLERGSQTAAAEALAMARERYAYMDAKQAVATDHGLPPGWSTAVSRKTGKMYYISPIGESTYNHPGASRHTMSRTKAPRGSQGCGKREKQKEFMLKLEKYFQ